MGQQLANSQLRFVELRLRISHRAAEHFGNFLMLVALDFV
jgi:hypothetical protein